MYIASSDASPNIWSLKFVHPFSKSSRFIGNVLSIQRRNHWTVLSCLLTTLCPLLVLALPKCFWVETASISWRVNIFQVHPTLLRQRIGHFSEIFLLEFSAQFQDTLWECPHLPSSLVQVMRMIVVGLKTFQHNCWSVCLWDLWLDLFVTRYSFRQVEGVQIFQKGFQIFGRIWLLLQVFWLTWGIRPWKSFARQRLQVFRALSLYLSSVDAKRNLHELASSSPQEKCLVYP